MKIRTNLLAGLLLCGAGLSGAFAQGFTSGSTGTDGALNVTSNTLLALPANGIFNFTTVTIAPNVTLYFAKNPLNTPIYILATGDVVINGYINVSGGSGSGNPPVGGVGGPGGFDGGLPGADPSSIPPGAGYGPGAGLPGPNNVLAAGAGAGGYGSGGSGGNSTNHGGIYGSPLLVPLVGGSGGGGTTGSPGAGGGGGGGAILIASSTRIVMNGTGHIIANSAGSTSAFNGGSGGAIRLVAPSVSGNGEVNVYGNNGGGYGRIRIDALDRSNLSFAVNPPAASSIGAAMFLFPNPIPRLDVISAAGQTIPVGNANPVTVVLPFGSSTNSTITVQAKDFIGIVPIKVVLTPENGLPSSFLSQIDMSTGNPAQTTINVSFPVNVRTIVNAWTR